MEALVPDSVRNSDPAVKAHAWDYYLRRVGMGHRLMDECLEFGRAAARRERATAKRGKG